jgi:plastocyanin
MAITHVYIAPDATVKAGCAPLPADATTSGAPKGTRAHALYRPIPLWKLDPAGRPVRRGEPEHAPISTHDSPAIGLRTSGFSPENVTIRSGDVVRWPSATTPGTTSPSPPGRGSSPGRNGGKGDQVQTRFGTPGRYQLLCYLHPMRMREQVTVLP